MAEEHPMGMTTTELNHRISELENALIQAQSRELRLHRLLQEYMMSQIKNQQDTINEMQNTE